jgi:hypothetical protein
MMSGFRSKEGKEVRAARRRNHIAKDLRTPKYRHQTVEPRRREDEDERRFRKYKELDDECE